MCSNFENPDFLLVATFLFLYIWLWKSIPFSLYSRWWGGWAVGEAGTAGWTPQRSASSPSTASWTDPSWLRPLASWVTRGSGSDRQQLSRTGCESPGGAESQTTARRWKEKEGSGLLGARTVLFWLCAFTHRPRPVSGPVCVSVRWVPELSVSDLDLTSTVFDSRAMHLTRSPPSSFPEGLMLCAASGEAAGTFISLDRYAN